MRQDRGGPFGICRATPLLAAAAALLATGSAHAYRPFDGTDGEVAPPQELELELGPIGYLRQGETSDLIAPAYVLNLGIVPDWELVFEGKNVVALEPEPQAGLEDVALDVKWVLRRGSLQDRAGPSIAAELDALLPSVQESTFGTSLLLVASERWRVCTVHVNLEGAYDRAHHGMLFGSVILEGPVSWRARPVLETFVERELGERTEVSQLMGAIWPIGSELAFDAGLRLAWVDERVLELRLGLTWAFAPGPPPVPGQRQGGVRRW